MNGISSVTDSPRPNHAHRVVIPEATTAVEAIMKENHRKPFSNKEGSDKQWQYTAVQKTPPHTMNRPVRTYSVNNTVHPL